MKHNLLAPIKFPPSSSSFSHLPSYFYLFSFSLSINSTKRCINPLSFSSHSHSCFSPPLHLSISASLSSICTLSRLFTLLNLNVMHSPPLFSSLHRRTSTNYSDRHCSFPSSTLSPSLSLQLTSPIYRLNEFSTSFQVQILE